MKFIAALLLAVSLLVPSTARAEMSDKVFIEWAKQAVGLLYSQDESGGLRMRCTVTAFNRIKLEAGYRYSMLSAAHCVGEDDVNKERSAKSDNISFYVTKDETGIKQFFKAKVKLIGYQHRGEDFAVFNVDSNEDWPILELGDEKLEVAGAKIINISAPLGLGIQVLRGQISSLDLDRPIIEGDIDWQHSLVLQLAGVNGGSSGSALISEDSRKIIGTLVGTIGGSQIIGIPISRFKAVVRAFEAGKYHWYKPKEELTEDIK